MTLHATSDGRICHGDMVATGRSACVFTAGSTDAKPLPGTPLLAVLQCPLCGTTAYGDAVGTIPEPADA